jgi:exodeoxyribonuclease-5
MNEISLEENFYKLPELVTKEDIVKKKIITKPNIDTLTEEQLLIFNEITELPLGVFSQSLLTGYSGTGKSFLVSKIIEQMLWKNKKLKIAITAPTNKAVRVLKELSQISEDSENVDFITLHSLLGLKRVITQDGKEIFSPTYGESGVESYNIVLVDEVSMLDNELYTILKTETKMNAIVVLFIGDRGQIPPVNGGESVLFSHKLNNNYNLTKIIRQANDNPIIELAQLIRTNQTFNRELNINENNQGVVFMKINTEEKLLKTYFTSKNFNKDANFVKVLAWTNNAVNYYNDKIREMIYGEDIGRLCVGEKMVCNKPIVNTTKKVLMNNNDEFEVLSFIKKKENRAFTFYYYEVKAKCDKKEPIIIKILAEESEISYDKELKSLEKTAVEAHPMLKRNAWTKFYALKERYADVKYNYALTVHKSQGSTFDNAIVIECDIKRLKNKLEKDKLLYTAVTRAKDKLFVI